MRRKDKEITGRADIEAVLQKAAVCRIGLCDGGMPYVVPVNFGYKDGALYVHSYREGRKLEILRKNSAVCFEVDVDTALVPAGAICDWSAAYRSVVGFGTASLIEDNGGKRRALDIIVRHYTGGAYEFSPGELDKIVIIKITVESMTGKQSGF